MFCPKCGKENAEDAKFCSSCGAFIEISSGENNTVNENIDTQGKMKTSGFAIAGLIFSIAGIFVAGLILGLTGFVCSLLALKMIMKDKTLKGNGLAVSGLVLSIIDVVVMIIYLNM